MATSIQKSRRVSFDLEHNTIHVLPTEKQVKEHADRLRREAYQNRTLNQELLDDSIISEIVASCNCNSRQDEGICLKSCLKKPPTRRHKRQRQQRRIDDDDESRRVIHVH
ncbi:uncharacterized protein BX664DRAFT_328471 [Halteromyces radiatus]|uniref:uncharacterized protein n=1 Tax=Halteromyces radiatus TaxID=101107 RepID=UPI00221F57D7|nr:uncharacterized protein BX664DRAFT_328471 [Halteromyces radiatus]KAI8092905.1 hypothetical protein BX664DRAFT_328471 [Halteromyces radiatus]